MTCHSLARQEYLIFIGKFSNSLMLPAFSAGIGGHPGASLVCLGAGGALSARRSLYRRGSARRSLQRGRGGRRRGLSGWFANRAGRIPILFCFGNGRLNLTSAQVPASVVVIFFSCAGHVYGLGVSVECK